MDFISLGESRSDVISKNEMNLIWDKGIKDQPCRWTLKEKPENEK